MHVILTGIDRSGKSYLAKELSKNLYLPVVNKLCPKNNIFIECVDFLVDTPIPTIVDRFHIDEQVYGPVLRGSSRFDFRQYRIIDLLMLMMDTVNIFCYDKAENVKERLKRSFERQLITESQVENILTRYQDAMLESPLDWIPYTIGTDLSTIIDKVQVKLGSINQEQKRKFLRYRTLGKLTSKVLFVGDRYGDKLLPPLVPFGNNDPGLRLFQAIDQLQKVSWRNVLITNSIKLNGNGIDHKQALVEECSLPSIEVIICLGNNAYENVCLTGIKKRIEKIPHPSAWFVYKNGSVDDYAMQISKAING